MTLFTKTLFFLILINIDGIICPRKICSGGLCFRGQSSNSRANTSVQREEKEFDTFLHGAENEKDLKEKFQDCIKKLHLIFKENLAVDSFLHAFLHIRKKTLHQDPQFTKSIGAYYKDLLNTALELTPIQLWTPQEFCSTMFPNEEIICTQIIEGVGCDENIFGLECVKHLYLTWKSKKIPYPNSIRGTENLYDVDLISAISRGSGNINDFPDHQLLANYYRINNMQRNPYINLPSDMYHDENDYIWQYQQYQQQADKLFERNHLYDARIRAYGIGNVSYKDLCREYERRQSIIKVYDDNYAIYLHNQIKSHVSLVGSNFKNREQFCKEYVSRKQNYEVDEQETEQQNYQQSEQ